MLFFDLKPLLTPPPKPGKRLFLRPITLCFIALRYDPKYLRQKVAICT